MTNVAGLLATVRARGATVEVAGGRLVIRPRKAVADLASTLAEHAQDLAAAVRAERVAARPSRPAADGYATREVAAIRDAYAGLTAAERGRLEAEAAGGDPLANSILRTIATDADAEPVAWRIYSRRLNLELWLVRDLEALAQLEHDRALGDLPAVLADELADLAGLDDATLRAVLACKATFGRTTRVVDLPPDDDEARS